MVGRAWRRGKHLCIQVPLCAGFLMTLRCFSKLRTATGNMGNMAVFGMLIFAHTEGPLSWKTALSSVSPEQEHVIVMGRINNA